MGIVVVAGAIMYFGADLIVSAAQGFLVSTTLSESFVGAILVGSITILPNSAIIIYASHKPQYDLSFGNLIGDSLASIPLVLGVVVLFHPLLIAKESIILLHILALASILLFVILNGDPLSFKVKAVQKDIKKMKPLSSLSPTLE